ncbi:MAG: trypsin, partial [Planctomycetaceae bacterium]|nr:trypsin [Planctomycetaceae bacterium]
NSTGANAWRLGSQAPQDNNTWNISRVNIAAGVEVRPGESYTFTFNVRAPATAGQYNMQWRMVQENVQWFGQYTPLRQVSVVAASGG